MATIHLDSPKRRSPRASVSSVSETDGSENTKLKNARKVLKENVSENAAWLTFGWAFFIIFIGMLVGSWWWGKLQSWVAVAFIVGFTLYAYMMPDNPRPFRHTFGTFMVTRFMPFALALYLIFGSNLGDRVTNEGWPWLKAQWSSWVAPSTTSGNTSFNNTTLHRPTSCPDPSVFVKMASEAWIEALPSKDARRMINAFYRESSGRFCDSNGRIVVNEQNNDAIGAMGLKRSLHEKEAKKLGLNIYDPVDHLKYSVILRKKDGEAPWKESFDYLDNLEVKVETLKAEQGKWTKAMKYGPLCWEEPDGDVLMRDERGEVTPLPAWSEKQPVVYATTASYSTKSSEPVEVLFKCLIE